MRRAILVLVVWFAFLPGIASADKQDISTMDGTDWAEWTMLQKHSFISGFIAGSAYVLRNNIQPQDDKYDSDKASKMFWVYWVPDDKKPKNTFSRNEVSLLLGNQAEGLNASLYRYAIIEITNGQLVEGLNAFYSDFKNKQIKLSDAVYVVKKQVKGASAEDIETVLQFLRADKDYKKLTYTDKDGKKKWATFP